MGCYASKDQSPSDQVVPDVEERIFGLLKDHFCASGPEASLFGSILKEEMLMKLQAKKKKIETTEEELRQQDQFFSDK